MADYIDREKAIKAVKHAWAKGLEPTQYIEEIPAADVAPVVHAHWIAEIVAIETVYGTDMKERVGCSKCKHKFLEAAKTYLFCPMCGAKMDEKEKNG